MSSEEATPARGGAAVEGVDAPAPASPTLASLAAALPNPGQVASGGADDEEEEGSGDDAAGAADEEEGDGGYSVWAAELSAAAAALVLAARAFAPDPPPRGAPAAGSGVDDAAAPSADTPAPPQPRPQSPPPPSLPGCVLVDVVSRLAACSARDALSAGCVSNAWAAAAADPAAWERAALRFPEPGRCTDARFVRLLARVGARTTWLLLAGLPSLTPAGLLAGLSPALLPRLRAIDMFDRSPAGSARLPPVVAAALAGRATGFDPHFLPLPVSALAGDLARASAAVFNTSRAPSPPSQASVAALERLCFAVAAMAEHGVGGTPPQMVTILHPVRGLVIAMDRGQPAAWRARLMCAAGSAVLAIAAHANAGFGAAPAAGRLLFALGEVAFRELEDDRVARFPAPGEAHEHWSAPHVWRTVFDALRRRESLRSDPNAAAALAGALVFPAAVEATAAAAGHKLVWTTDAGPPPAGLASLLVRLLERHVAHPTAAAALARAVGDAAMAVPAAADEAVAAGAPAALCGALRAHLPLLHRCDGRGHPGTVAPCNDCRDPAVRSLRALCVLLGRTLGWARDGPATEPATAAAAADAAALGAHSLALLALRAPTDARSDTLASYAAHAVDAVLPAALSQHPARAAAFAAAAAPALASALATHPTGEDLRRVAPVALLALLRAGGEAAAGGTGVRAAVARLAAAANEANWPPGLRASAAELAALAGVPGQ